MSENIKLPGSNSHHFESSLCFPKDVFYANTFDVDAFVSHYKKEHSLERLRDDLTIFLKVLEMSMSDLINKDYPDFVNLSTNLVDLDKAINELRVPLETNKLDVESVRNSIDNEIGLIMSKLNEKLQIEKRRIVLKLLINWQRSLKVTNEMIGNNSSQKISGDHVQRIAFEFCQLKNSLSICAREDKSTSLTQDIDKLSCVLENIMKDLFIDCLKNAETPYSSEHKQQFKHVLKSYSLLGKEKIAEDLYTEHTLKPFMEQFINEDFLQTNIQKLNGVYEKILEFIDLNAEFFSITNQINGKTNEEKTNDESLKTLNNGFDLLINSICSQSYKFFVKKWPIQVYFQIRFQEIVSKFELDLIDYTKEVLEDGENILLNVSDCLIKSIEFIWSEQKCFLKCLIPNFWRLNLQLINRYNNFFTSLIKPKIDSLGPTVDQENLNTLSNDLNFNFNLLNDIYELYNFKLPNIFDGLIAPIFRNSSNNLSIQNLKDAFYTSIQTFNNLENFTIELISRVNIEKCLIYLKMSNDIPRIYRRTNRDVPKLPSGYISQTIDLIALFKTTFSSEDKTMRQKEMVKKCIHNIIDSICLSYQSISSDLLESVKKMEDSLKRLQRVKQKNKSSANLNNPIGSVSDDDKIRIQLYLDIIEFGKLLDMNFGYKGESNYDALLKLVEEFAKLGQENQTNQPCVQEENEIV
ncbi:unnamed protein product [Brachionus calyciflorus]|uniref:Conserved oligomeric Golgi complex subunit 2 n=1 Tax=Brachionus calyciflorus TaxID=104777 RepID=A0A813Y7G1_9BILA|nr:unnamed protein product [Brachionus calyciflorus]